MKFTQYRQSSFFTERFNRRDAALFHAAFKGDLGARRWVRNVVQLFAEGIGATLGQAWQAFMTGNPKALVEAINKKREEKSKVGTDPKTISDFLSSHWTFALTMRTGFEMELEGNKDKRLLR